MSKNMIRAAVLFAALTAAGVCVVLVGTTLSIAAASAVLTQVGGAMIAGSLAFFAIESFHESTRTS
jgi:hypothetical protein